MCDSQARAGERYSVGRGSRMGRRGCSSWGAAGGWQAGCQERAHEREGLRRPGELGWWQTHSLSPDEKPPAGPPSPHQLSSRAPGPSAFTVQCVAGSFLHFPSCVKCEGFGTPEAGFYTENIIQKLPFVEKKNLHLIKVENLNN